MQEKKVSKKISAMKQSDISLPAYSFLIITIIIKTTGNTNIYMCQVLDSIHKYNSQSIYLILTTTVWGKHY